MVYPFKKFNDTFLSLVFPITNRLSYILVAILSIYSLSSNHLAAQSNSIPDNIISEARLSNLNLEKFLIKNIIYPTYSLQKNEQGYVIIQFDINEKSELVELHALLMPSLTLQNAVLHVLDQTKEKWQAAQSQAGPVNKTYKIAVNFIITPEGISQNHFAKAKSLIDRKKYKKALVQLDKALEVNKFDAYAYLERSKVKAILDDQQGAENDYKLYSNYKSQFLLSIIISAKPTSSSEVIFGKDARR